MIVLITGASGSGKTTTLKALQEKLAPSSSIHFFDDMGVPSMEDMITLYESTERWQQITTHKWIEKLLSCKDEIIVLEGSFNPEFAVEILRPEKNIFYMIICLNAERSVREQRLISDRNQSELATDDMEIFANFLREKTIDLGGVIIDTTNQSISEVADEVNKQIEYKLKEILT